MLDSWYKSVNFGAYMNSLPGVLAEDEKVLSRPYTVNPNPEIRTPKPETHIPDLGTILAAEGPGALASGLGSTLVGYYPQPVERT